MNRLFFCAAALLITSSALAANPLPEPQPATNEGATDSQFKTTKDKVSYAIGLNIGNSMKNEGLDLNLEMLFQGLKDVMDGKKPALSEEQMRAAMLAMQQEQMAKQKAAAEAELKKGEAYLAANKAKEGVITLPSGLQYKVLKAGTGATPKSTDTVSTHYKGTFIDGEVFDSSYDRGEPASFPVTGVIPGWVEALQKMKVGDKWQLFIPSNLAYGPNGRPGIPGNSVLIFEMELLDIVK